MSRFIITFITAFLIILVTTFRVSAENRVALVISNAAYEHASIVTGLRQGTQAVSKALDKIGFRVVEISDADLDTMEDALRDFRRSLRAPDAVGFFYFAGHAVQHAGKNYLVPIDANLQSSRDARYDAIDFGRFLERAYDGAGRINITVLNTSRENPFGGGLSLKRKGLAEIEVPFGNVVLSAAAPNQVTASSQSDEDVFANVLAETIPIPDLEITDAFERVRRQIERKTQGNQQPWIGSSVIDSITLVPTEEPDEAVKRSDRPAVVLKPDSEIEKELESGLWRTALKDGSSEAFSIYLDLYPEGEHAVEARKKLAALKPIRQESDVDDVSSPDTKHSSLREFRAEDPQSKSLMPSVPGNKVALVVGIDEYVNLPPSRQLRKAVNDSVAVARKFHRLGFRVVWAKELDRRGFYRKLDEFKRLLEPGGVAAVFFAGHGIEIKGANYLLPSDVPKLAHGEEEVLRSETISVSTILSVLQERQTRINLVILDACRDNPFADGATRSLGSSRGLAIVKPPRGTFVMYSAGAHQTALDRLSDEEDSPNSVFTRTLLPLMDASNLSVQAIAKRVQQDVAELAKRIGHPQYPAYYDEIIGHYFLHDSGRKERIARPLPPELVTPSPRTKKEDKLPSPPQVVPNDRGAAEPSLSPDRLGDMAFVKCLESTDRTCFEDFIRAHPKHRRAEQAEKILHTRAELAEYQKCVNETDETRQLMICEIFLIKFPEGRFDSEIKELLESLKRKKRQNRKFASRPPDTRPSYEPRRQTRDFTLYTNYDLPYSDYKRLPNGYSLEYCRNSCQQDTRCKAFTYNSSFKACFLKDAVPQLKAHNGAISGVLQGHTPSVAQSAGLCGSGFHSYDNVDFFGNDMSRHGHTASFQGCRQLCLNSRGCVGFSWIKPVRRVSRRCWLKHAIGKRVIRSYVTSCARR